MHPRRQRLAAAFLWAAICFLAAGPAGSLEGTKLELSTTYAGGRWCIRVSGTRQAVKLKLHNLTPGVHRLVGGQEQVVETSGGKPNRVCRAAPRIGPGTGLLAVRVVSEGEAQGAGDGEEPAKNGNGPPQIQQLSRLSRLVLRRIGPVVARFAAERARLRRDLSRSRQGPASVKRRVRRLLETTEKRLLRALRPRRLAALQDKAREVFATARRDLAAAGSTTTADSSWPQEERFGPSAAARRPGTTDRGETGVGFAPRVSLVARHRVAGSPRTAAWRTDAGAPVAASGPPASDATVRQAEAETILDRIAGFLHQIETRAADDDLALDLCIESAPETGFEFTLSPPSYKKGGKRVVTDGRLLNVYRGLYDYKMIHKGFRPVLCPDPADPEAPCRLDLWDDSRTVLRCRLARDDDPDGVETCERLKAVQGECGADGR